MTAVKAPALPEARAYRARHGRRGLGGLGWIGVAMLAVLVLCAVFAPALARHDPDVTSGLPFASPDGSHPLGTDDLGRDLFAQLLFGARVSLFIGVAAAVISVTIGATVALIAGYYRGAVETVLMRIVDLMLAFPFIVLVVVFAAFFGRGLFTTIVVIAGVIWARPARVLRSQVIKVRQFDHVLAAASMGASGARVIGRHVLPRIAPLAAVQFVRAANVAVLIEASLAFLGLGDPGRESWGTTLYFAQARNAFLTDSWVWWILPPGLGLTMAILGFAFLGYAIEEWADPRLERARVRRRATRRRSGKRPSKPARHQGGEAATSADRTEPLALEVSGLSVHYASPDGPVRAVQDVSLSLARNQVVGLVGESGSGKTTLVMGLLGLLRPPGRVGSGTVHLNGRDLGFPRRSEIAAARGRDIALVPQSAMNAMNPAYTVLAQVAEAAALTMDGRAATAKARDLLSSVGITADRHRAFPHELSGGMRQRAVIAMALANDPVVLVADEPVTGLDVVTQARILRLLLEVRERYRIGVLLISHDLPLVARVADELVVMYAGRVVESGPTAVVTAEPAHPYTRLLLDAFPTLRGPRRALVAIGGEPPDLSHLSCGCSFEPRCPVAVAECPQRLPDLFDQGDGRRAACLLRERQ